MEKKRNNPIRNFNSNGTSPIRNFSSNGVNKKILRGILLLAIVMVLIAWLPRLSVAQPVTLWTKTFGGTSWDWGYSVQQTTDGGYIITGWTVNYGSGLTDLWLIKTNPEGDTLWTKTFGGTLNDEGYSVQQTTDGGYIITGYTDSYGAGNSDIWLIKTNTEGDTLWTKTFGGGGYEQGRSVQQTTDGGYIITGHTSSYGAGWDDVYLIKTDSEGETLWTKTFGGTLPDGGNSVQQTTDGGYIITGKTYSYSGSHNIDDEDVWLIKTDPEGNTLWTKTWGGWGGDVGYSVKQTTDGGYIITGVVDFYGQYTTGHNVWLIKTNPEGETLWKKIFSAPYHLYYGNRDDGKSVQQTTDGGYIITGRTAIYPEGVGDVWLLKTNTEGDTLWTMKFGGNSADAGYSVQQTTDGGYIITGWTCSYGAGWGDVYLIKVSPEPVTVSVPDTTYGVAGDTISIPVSTEDLTGLGVLSAEFNLTYNSDILTGIDVDTSGTLLSGTDWNCEYNVVGDTFYVTLAGTDTLAGSGALINLTFFVSPDADLWDESPLHFENFMFNEGIPPVIKDDGLFIVIHSLVGAIEGIVADAANGNFIENAIVAAYNIFNYCDTTDINGYYYMPEVQPYQDTYNMTVTAFGYNEFDTTGVVVLPGETTEMNFSILHPEIVVVPSSFVLTVPVDTTYDATMTISNTGNGPLEFDITYENRFLKSVDIRRVGRTAVKTSIELEPAAGTIDEPAYAISDIAPNAAQWNGARNPSDILWWYDVQSATDDYQCLGVEFDGTYYYITGSGGIHWQGINKLHFFDKDGTYITSIDQPTYSEWGWRDIAYDGNYMYSSDDSYVTKWYVAGLPDNPVLEVVGNFPGPCSPNRALAYDPATDHFWVANWDCPIFEIDRSGTIINAFPNPNEYDIYGMAWDNVSPDGPYLWIHTQDYLNVRQFDPVNGVYTGLVYEGYANIPGYDVAGGACFAIQEGFGLFIGLTQNSPDLIYGMEVCPGWRWITVNPISGEVLPVENFEVTLHFDATEAVPDSTYTTNILIHNNSADSPVDIPVTLHVTSFGVEDPNPQVPGVFALRHNYPNPLNPSTTISYTLPKSTKVSLSIYNIKGQLVETLVDEVQQAGNYSIVWNVHEKSGISSGIYFYRITAGDFTDTKKCVILK